MLFMHVIQNSYELHCGDKGADLITNTELFIYGACASSIWPGSGHYLMDLTRRNRHLPTFTKIPLFLNFSTTLWSSDRPGCKSFARAHDCLKSETHGSHQILPFRWLAGHLMLVCRSFCLHQLKSMLYWGLWCEKILGVFPHMLFGTWAFLSCDGCQVEFAGCCWEIHQNWWQIYSVDIVTKQQLTVEC